MLTRRSFVAASSVGLLRAAPPDAFARLEAANGGRLGVAILNTATGERSGHRAAERFPMCSTFKFLLAAAVLRRADRRQQRLEQTIAIPHRPLLSHSPLTEAHSGGTMTVADLCRAILIQSDNTAANLLLETIGGPPEITQFARDIGDPVTRLDRTELALNEALDGDPRDTTSPAAMAGNLDSIVLGNVLKPDSRTLLRHWMEECETGLDRLRAKLPPGWHAADKTGSNGEHTSNDIAVLWPPNSPPIVVAAYITQCQGPETKRAAILAEIGRLLPSNF